MPTIKDFGAFKVYMYFHDENPPHFHVEAPDYRARVRIDRVEVIGGAMPSKTWRRVRRWAAANRALLEETWNRLNEL